MARRFNQSQRIDIFIRQDGKCALCGEELQPSWHADHIMPYSKGGWTVAENGQALCPECNLKKGDRIMYDTVQLRGFQKTFRENALNKFRDGDKIFVANVYPGSGKHWRL